MQHIAARRVCIHSAGLIVLSGRLLLLGLFLGLILSILVVLLVLIILVEAHGSYLLEKFSGVACHVRGAIIRHS